MKSIALVISDVDGTLVTPDKQLTEASVRAVALLHERGIGFSIVSQCLFYKVHRPIAELLVGREEYTHFNLPVIAEHITRFSLAALGQGAPVTAPSSLELMS